MVYSMEGQQLLWKGKPARLAKGAVGRRITDTMATDGRKLYFAQKHVPLPKGIDLSKARMRVFDENPVNLRAAILDDGATVWQLNQQGSLEVVPLPGADFESVARFETVGIYRNRHLKDRHRVWYRGVVLDGLAADKARVLAENIASDGDALWIFGKRSAELGHGDITRVWSEGGHDLVRTDGVLLRLDGRNANTAVLATAPAPPHPDRIAQAALEALGRDMFGVFETYPQIIVPVGDMDWDKVRARPQSGFRARFNGPSLVLEADGIAPIRCRPDGWYRGLCSLWLRRRGFHGTLLTYPELGVMLPDGHAFRERLIKANRDAYLQLCGAAFAQGAQDEARQMLHAYVNTGWHRQDTPFDGQEALVASLPRQLFAGIAYFGRRHDFKSTTNLAAARQAVDSGLIADPDPRVRLEMLALIHATVIESDKTPLFCRHVLPAVLRRQENEIVASVREHADSVIEAFIIAGLVHAEVRHERMAPLVEPLVRRQIEQGVNVPLNRSRLIEVLIHQGRDTEAETAIAAFKAEFGAGFMLPGVYVNRPLHQTVDEAVEAMRERASELS